MVMVSDGGDCDDDGVSGSALVESSHSYNHHNHGPNREFTDPCGTPDFSHSFSKRWPGTLTCCFGPSGICGSTNQPSQQMTLFVDCLVEFLNLLGFA